MNKYLLFLIILVLVSVSVNAEYYVDVKDTECRENGHIRFVMSLDGVGNIYTRDIEVSITGPLGYSKKIIGEWGSDSVLARNQGGTLFKSDELVANLKGDYKVRLDYKLYQRTKNYELKTKEFYLGACPGLLFSCRLLSINIDNCYTKDNVFRADLTLKGLIPSDIKEAKIIDPYKGLKYEFETEKKYTDLNGKYSTKGGLPISATITRISKDKYVLESKLVNNSVKSLKIGFTDDRNYKYYYEIKKCIEEKGFVKEVSKQCEVKIEEKPKEIKEDTKKEVNIVEEEPKLREEPKDYTIYYMGGIIVLVVFIIVLILVKSQET